MEKRPSLWICRIFIYLVRYQFISLLVILNLGKTKQKRRRFNKLHGMDLCHSWKGWRMRFSADLLLILMFVYVITFSFIPFVNRPSGKTQNTSFTCISQRTIPLCHRNVFLFVISQFFRPVWYSIVPSQRLSFRNCLFEHLECWQGPLWMESLHHNQRNLIRNSAFIRKSKLEWSSSSRSCLCIQVWAFGLGETMIQFLERVRRSMKKKSVKVWKNMLLTIRIFNKACYASLCLCNLLFKLVDHHVILKHKKSNSKIISFLFPLYYCFDIIIQYYYALWIWI